MYLRPEWYSVFDTQHFDVSVKYVSNRGKIVVHWANLTFNCCIHALPF